MMRRAALLLVAVLALAPLALWAQETHVRVEVAREGGGTPTVGDPLIVRVDVEYPADAELVVPGNPVRLGDLEPAAPQVSAPSAGHTVIVYRTRAFRTGQLQVEPPALEVLRGGATMTLEVPATVLEVASVLPADPAERTPRPLKEAEAMDGGPPDLTPVLGPVAAVVAGFVLARLVRASLRRRPDAPSVPLPSDAQRALVRLRELETASAELPIPMLCEGISATVRRYLADAYRLPADALTSSELPPRLSRAGADANTVQMVRNLLHDCDRVRYAGDLPGRDRATRYFSLAAAIITAPSRATTVGEAVR